MCVGGNSNKLAAQNANYSRIENSRWVAKHTHSCQTVQLLPVSPFRAMLILSCRNPVVKFASHLTSSAANKRAGHRLLYASHNFLQHWTTIQRSNGSSTKFNNKARLIWSFPMPGQQIRRLGSVNRRFKASNGRRSPTRCAMPIFIFSIFENDVCRTQH